jgi:bifunctional non-homologous end joining protein LigD
MIRTASGKTPVTVDNRRLELSNLDKVMYPESGFTKGQVIDYYNRIAPVMLPHLRDRPITLKRYPDGVDGHFFFQKNCPGHRPKWVKIVNVQRLSRSGGDPIEFCVLNDAPALVWTANLASIELHTYLSRRQNVERPTMMVFDLDPGEGRTMIDCLEVGRRLRDALAHFGLSSLPKTSGGKGLHLAVPLNTSASFDDTKSFSRAIAQVLERDDPKLITTNMRKDLRVGRVLVDWSQNDRHKTTVCVYSLRARVRPTVSTPVTWDEVEDALGRGRSRKRREAPLTFEAEDVLRRMEEMGDLHEAAITLKQRLPSSERIAT